MGGCVHVECGSGSEVEFVLNVFEVGFRPDPGGQFGVDPPPLGHFAAAVPGDAAPQMLGSSTMASIIAVATVAAARSPDRCSSTVKRVLRSTGVPIALLWGPMIRSSSP